MALWQAIDGSVWCHGRAWWRLVGPAIWSLTAFTQVRQQHLDRVPVRAGQHLTWVATICRATALAALQAGDQS
jgi:hypothetical protein